MPPALPPFPSTSHTFLCGMYLENGPFGAWHARAVAQLDAVVVGAGPNGLTAAVTLARAGLGVRVYEANDTVGGGARTAELTVPGFRHDVCSAVHPLGAGSPALARLPLDEFGLEWVQPDVPMAHPMVDGSAVVLARSVDETAQSLGGRDAARYRRLVGPFVERWDELAPEVLRPVLAAVPRHPVMFARFGLRAMQPVSVLAHAFRGERARALVAGMAGHAIAPLSSPFTGGVALMFALTGHEVGWPFPRGGAQGLSNALAAYLRSMGGEIETGARVVSMRDLPDARAHLFDTSPSDLVAIAGDRLPSGYVRRVARYRRGPAVFKVDYALDGPVPWTAEECRRAGTVHVGASIGEIGAALDAVGRGRPPDPPFLITAQPTMYDPTRAPAGKHVLWAYGHVPFGWTGDLTGAIERQIERFAPGFRDLVVGRAAAGPAAIEARDANNVGGDISCGRFGGRQVLFRPVVTRVPYRTPDPKLFLCSAATPPGPGVHGMCGFHAARVVLRDVFGMTG